MLGMSCMFHPPGPPARFPHCLMTGSDTLWRVEVSCAAEKTLRIPVCSGARSLAPGRSLWHWMLAEIITSPGRQTPPLAPSSWVIGTVEGQLLWLGLMGLKSLALHFNMTQGVLNINICSCNPKFAFEVVHVPLKTLTQTQWSSPEDGPQWPRCLCMVYRDGSRICLLSTSGGGSTRVQVLSQMDTG